MSSECSHPLVKGQTESRQKVLVPFDNAHAERSVCPMSGRGWLQRLIPAVSFLLFFMVIALVGRDSLLLPLPPQRPAARPLYRHPRLYPSSRTLAYYSEFEYLINNNVCGEGQITAVVVVHSNPRKPEVRDAIRRSLPQSVLKKVNVRRVFMLGDATYKVAENETVIDQSVVVAENAQHEDIVQGNFHDSYHNLTYKHLMALDWAVTYCPQARWIVKMDVDIVYDVYALLRFMETLPDVNYLGGNLIPQARPFRDTTKWVVSREEWPREFYPPYLSGWLYIVTPDVARQLVTQSTILPFFWIDDTYVTGILAEQLPITVSGFKQHYVTDVECLKLRVSSQKFELSKPSSWTMYSPGFLVGPSERDLEVLEKFNLLTRYCHLYTCQTPPASKICYNKY